MRVIGACVGSPKVQVFLPRLKLEESCALESFLCSSRMTGVFEKAKADFPGMFTRERHPRLRTALSGGQRGRQRSAPGCSASLPPSGAANQQRFALRQVLFSRKRYTGYPHTFPSAHLALIEIRDPMSAAIEMAQKVCAQCFLNVRAEQPAAAGSSRGVRGVTGVAEKVVSVLQHLGHP